MANPKEIPTTSVFYIDVIESPKPTDKNIHRESKGHHHHLEQKLQNFRTRVLGDSSSHEDDHSTAIEPVKPMRYVRHFNVSVSLKKSRLLSRHSSTTKQWAIGKRHFNEDPSEGIRWLVENNLLQNTPEHIAEFLFNEQGLSKRVIGDYLGEKNDQRIEVLKHFAHLHDFFSIDIVEALRHYLIKFLLPGEAQKIDRIMEAFAQRYYECHPDTYQNAEVCFILSFAIIMLNTALHNKSARLGGSLTYDKFVSNLQGAISQQQMPNTSLIKNIYESIKNNELKFPDDDVTLSNISARIQAGDSVIIKEGWLWKQGGRVRNWKRRWFVITDGFLSYFESRTEVDYPRGIVPLVDVGVRESEVDRSRQFCFELFPLAGEKMKSSKLSSTETGKITEGHHSLYRMSGSSEEDRKDWLRALRIASRNELPKQRTT